MLLCCKSAWSASRWGWLSIFFTSSRTRKFSASFTTACGNPDTLKSMSLSSSWVNCSPPTGLPFLVWSASTFSSASVLSDFNCYQESCISTYFKHTILLREPFHSFLVLLQYIFLRRIIGRRCRCFHQRTFRLKQLVRLSFQYKSPCSCLTTTVFFTQIWDCSVDTELINRNYCAKTVSIVSPSAQKCIDNCPPPLLLSVPRDNGLVARKTGCPLSLNLTIVNSATLSHSPCGLSI